MKFYSPLVIKPLFDYNPTNHMWINMANNQNLKNKLFEHLKHQTC
jgi:hypothetical protein